MPVDDATKQTKGYAFIEFSSAAEAQAAQEQTDGYKLDKQHVFKARATARVRGACAAPHCLHVARLSRACGAAHNPKPCFLTPCQR